MADIWEGSKTDPLKKQQGTLNNLGGGAGQPWYKQDDIDWFQQQAQGRYGRQANAGELAQIGANSTNRESAMTYADTLAKQQGWQGPAATTTTTTPTATVNTTTQTAEQQNQAALQQRLQEMLTQGNTINPNSQQFTTQRDAFRRGQGRAVEDAKRAAAERAAGSGTLDSGGFDASQQGIDMQAAQGEGDFEAGLMQRELSTQRDQLMQAMQLAQQSGLSDQARQLQERLHTIDSQIAREGQQLQGRLGQGDLDLRRLLGMGQLGLGNAQLQQQGGQFNQQLGFEYWRNLQNFQNQQIAQLLGNGGA